MKTVFISKTIFIETRCDSNGKFLPTKYSIKSPFIFPINQIPKRRKIKLILFRTFKSEQSTALIRVCRIECAQICHRNISCISNERHFGSRFILAVRRNREINCTRKLQTELTSNKHVSHPQPLSLSFSLWINILLLITKLIN